MSPSTVPTAVSSNNLNSSGESCNKIQEMKQNSKAQAESQSESNAPGTSQTLAVDHLSKLFCDNVIVKIWKTAIEHLARETGPRAGHYLYRDAEFWTCGFFPGSLYCLLERSVRYPHAFLTDNGGDDDAHLRKRLRSELLAVCRRWAAPLHGMSSRKDTHDIGFIVEPALRRDFELTGDGRSLESIVHAAESLASRYSETTKAIRSWDRFVNNSNNYVDKDSDFLVIIDSMCNLDLLYYAGHHASSQHLIDIATTHAHTIRKTHLRPVPGGSEHPLYSTCHVANLCPQTGAIRERLTAQGYSAASTWSRGQAWAILGFAQTHAWTRNPAFLRTARGLADYFLLRLQAAPACTEREIRPGVRAGRLVPLWDFDAPVAEASPLRDASAAVIAANGLLLIAQAVAAEGGADAAALFEKYHGAAVAIVSDTIALCYAPDRVELVGQQAAGAGSVSVGARQAPDSESESFECILRCSTANFNQNWTDRYADHGLLNTCILRSLFPRPDQPHGETREMAMSDTRAVKHKSSIEKIPDDGAEVLHYDAHPSAEEMAEAIASAKVAPLSRPLLKLYCFCAVAFLCSTMNGYDGSIFGSLPAMKSFRDRFDVGKTGPKLGYISAMYTVGTVVSLPFTGPACDFRGRRAGILLGSLIVVASTVLSALAAGTPAFVAGRFFLGFGVSIVRCASSIWCAEISPPAYRGVLTAFYNCTYAVGALMAAGVTRGSVRYSGDAQWRVPVWCQLICPAIVAAFVLFFPESPRWLYAHGREQESRAFLTKYHGDGNPQHALVRVQIQEYRQVISRNGSDKKWWDYSDLYKNRAARWRMVNALIPSVWGQCSGNAVVSYYLPAMLMTTGMTRPDQILNINLGYTAISAVASYVGASLIEKMGRRPTSIWTSVACSLCFAGITAGTGVFAATKANSAASAGIAFIFIFGWCYNFGMTPLQALYPVECLSYEQRGKGLAFVFAFVHCLAFINQFCFPIALQDIGWKTYIVFIVWDLIQATISHLFSVETKGRSLEEMTDIFDAPNPVQASLLRKVNPSLDV
ncbi:hypothetical protein MY3296_000152 [Beauveria thailandica]